MSSSGSKTDDFNMASSNGPDGYVCAKKNDNLLQAWQREGEGMAFNYSPYGYVFDFFNRIVHVASGADKKELVHFRDFDRESLEWHFNKLKQLGGNPRPLPKDTPSAVSLRGKLKLD